MNSHRINLLNDIQKIDGPIIYWMSRDQRVSHNWALIRALELGNRHAQPVAVIFCLLPSFLNATLKHFSFMMRGLKEVQKKLEKKRIPFYLLQGKPETEIPKFLSKVHAGALITDFSPLKISRSWKRSLNESMHIHFEEVDAHNIVPVWVTSQKQEFGAYTIRPKIQRLLPEYLDEFPEVAQNHQWSDSVEKIDWDTMIPKDSSYEWIQPGEDNAYENMERFVENELISYTKYRNDPTKDAQSNLSPYLHFGHISTQYIALHIERSGKKHQAVAFLEESIIRKELSDNFCFYNTHYDSFEGFPNWAKQTLEIHRSDKREFTYSLEEFESAQTHEPLWNAAQKQMMKQGKMHGYMRMYWAKKILEWSKNPEEAMKTAIHLNDTYELDGRDPNGYTGISWSIGGAHDRAWFERPVFGKIRYMNYNGAKTKFNVNTYIETWS